MPPWGQTAAGLQNRNFRVWTVDGPNHCCPEEMRIIDAVSILHVTNDEGIQSGFLSSEQHGAQTWPEMVEMRTINPCGLVRGFGHRFPPVSKQPCSPPDGPGNVLDEGFMGRVRVEIPYNEGKWNGNAEVNVIRRIIVEGEGNGVFPNNGNWEGSHG